MKPKTAAEECLEMFEMRGDATINELVIDTNRNKQTIKDAIKKLKRHGLVKVSTRRYCKYAHRFMNAYTSEKPVDFHDLNHKANLKDILVKYRLGITNCTYAELTDKDKRQLASIEFYLNQIGD